MLAAFTRLHEHLHLLAGLQTWLACSHHLLEFTSSGVHKASKAAAIFNVVFGLRVYYRLQRANFSFCDLIRRSCEVGVSICDWEVCIRAVWIQVRVRPGARFFQHSSGCEFLPHGETVDAAAIHPTSACHLGSFTAQPSLSTTLSAPREWRIKLLEVFVKHWRKSGSGAKGHDQISTAAVRSLSPKHTERLRRCSTETAGQQTSCRPLQTVPSQPSNLYIFIQNEEIPADCNIQRTTCEWV